MEKFLKLVRSAAYSGDFHDAANMVTKDWLLADGYKVCVVNPQIEGLDIIASKPGECLGITVMSASKLANKSYPVWKSLLSKLPDGKRSEARRLIGRENTDRMASDALYLKTKYAVEMLPRTVVVAVDPTGRKASIYMSDGWHSSRYINEMKLVKSTILPKTKNHVTISGSDDIVDDALLFLVQDSKTVRRVLDTLFGASPKNEPA